MVALHTAAGHGSQAQLTVHGWVGMRAKCSWAVCKAQQQLTVWIRSRQHLLPCHRPVASAQVAVMAAL